MHTSIHLCYGWISTTVHVPVCYAPSPHSGINNREVVETDQADSILNVCTLHTQLDRQDVWVAEISFLLTSMKSAWSTKQNEQQLAERRPQPQPSRMIMIKILCSWVNSWWNMPRCSRYFWLVRMIACCSVLCSAPE